MGSFAVGLPESGEVQGGEGGESQCLQKSKMVKEFMIIKRMFLCK